MIEQAMSAGSENVYFWLWSAKLFEKTGRLDRSAFAMSRAIVMCDRWLLESQRQELRQKHADYLSRHRLSQ